MSYTPEPDFDENGWCHEVNLAPDNTWLDVRSRMATESTSTYRMFSKPSGTWYDSTCAVKDAPAAWRYPKDPIY